jgi:hypothetical protein
MKSAHLPPCREAAQFNNFLQTTPVLATLFVPIQVSGAPDDNR